ncbi:MAG: hypothetical protein FD146_224 [Anaerolineaceae bacterium]|nr:MAG: hypothetical protein FD146_224 [Anaerolineaceae bacterium]
MTVRSLDLLDLPFLSRYRQDALFLDSARFLTRGNPLSAMALLAYLDPRRNLYTAFAREDGDSLMGQVILNERETSARLTFLAPAEQVGPLAGSLLDHLTKHAGGWGAQHLLAEVDEDSPAFKSLRLAGFAMYAWQRVWKLPEVKGKAGKSDWQAVEETDWPAIQSLHGQIIPALIQPVDALPKQASGLVCRAGAEIQAYVRESSGPAGIWLQPLIPPDSGCGAEQLTGLARAVTGGDRRPVYVCVRSYQAWLESALADLGAQAGARQAVMVKRLVKTVREAQVVPVMEKALAKAKPAAPAARVESEK